jgi:hypothetical protein
LPSLSGRRSWFAKRLSFLPPGGFWLKDMGKKDIKLIIGKQYSHIIRVLENRQDFTRPLIFDNIIH